MLRRFSIIPGLVMLIALWVVSTSGACAATTSLEQACAHAFSVALNSTVRGDSAQPGAMHVFTLDVPVAGALALDVTLPGPAEADSLGPVAAQCSLGYA